ncbi:DUF4232 domain-containing protein [Streptomyces misionensis]|uniref:DUF4232 domain-containing protein n=2 Tax=Streptomyces misionensis TaxID=67331 RepID=A0A5C6JH89_9ACTN|nr:DUF4232 domain-containing protein [Streptomyces misionensis]TWV40380.1 DUF4232 domain-containing protein [Streptomyces misionensis]
MRRTRTPLLAVAGAALAALALTACDGGTGTEDEGAAKHSPSATASEVTPNANQPSADAKGGQDGTGAKEGTGSGSGTSSSGHGSAKQSSTGTHRGSTGSGSGSGGASDPWDPANRVLCNGSNTRVTAQLQSRPLNHMLLTVTNTGSKYCDLTYYPVLRFDGMQWAPQADESTHPQAVTTLAPGKSGYAEVRLSAADGSGDGGTTAHRLTVYFQGKTPKSDGGATANPTLPAKGVYYDSSLEVTYWQSDLSSISSW